MTQSVEPKQSTSSLSLAFITAGAIGAALLIISIASIAAMLSMGSNVNDELSTPPNQSGDRSKPVIQLEASGGDKLQNTNDHPLAVMTQLFDVLYPAHATAYSESASSQAGVNEN